MSKISIKNQEERNDVMMWVSDLYKDVYGIRPRGYNFSEWSNQELEDFVNDFDNLTNLKLRIGYGEVGNASLPAFFTSSFTVALPAADTPPAATRAVPPVSIPK